MEDYMGEKHEGKQKNKLSGLDKYLMFSFVMITIFTIVQTIITAITSVEQSTLITAYFAVYGGEVLMCALIKRFKLKDESEDKKDE
jgi:archaellum biogenesis protein FlaJ (TadC family)